MQEITQSDLDKLRSTFVHLLEHMGERKIEKEEYKLISKALVETFRQYNQGLKPVR